MEERGVGPVSRGTGQGWLPLMQWAFTVSESQPQLWIWILRFHILRCCAGIWAALE